MKRTIIKDQLLNIKYMEILLKTIYKNGTENGTRYYYRNGKLIAKSEYVKGILVRTILFDKKLKRDFKKIDSEWLTNLKIKKV